MEADRLELQNNMRRFQNEVESKHKNEMDLARRNLLRKEQELEELKLALGQQKDQMQ